MRNVAVLVLALVASAACYGLDSSSLGKAIGQSALLTAIALAAVALIRPASLRARGETSRNAAPARAVHPDDPDGSTTVGSAAAAPAACAPAATLTSRQLPTRRTPAGLRVPVALVCVAGLLGGAISWAAAGFPYPLASPQTAILAAQILALCALTGIAEEALYRAAMIEAFLPALGDDGRATLKAALASALIFAALHLSAPADGSVIALAQSLLKPVQAALFGFTLALLYCRTRSVWPCAALHAAFNALYLAPGLLAAGSLATTYATGQLPDLVMLASTTAILAIAAVLALRASRVA